MSIMDGYCFLEEFYKSGARYIKAKVVLLSTLLKKKDIELVDRYNLLGFVSKPLTKVKLSAIVSDFNQTFEP